MKGRTLLLILGSLLLVILVSGLLILIFTTFKLQEALKPKNPQYSAADLGQKAQSQIASGDYGQAENYLKQSLQQQDDGTYRSQLAVVEYQLKKYPDAIAQYRLLISKGQDVAFAENGIGNADRDWGKDHYSDAETAYRASFAADVGYVAAYSNLGLLLKSESKLSDAVAVVQAGVSETGDHSLSVVLEQLTSK